MRSTRWSRSRWRRGRRTGWAPWRRTGPCWETKGRWRSSKPSSTQTTTVSPGRRTGTYEDTYRDKHSGSSSKFYETNIFILPLGHAIKEEKHYSCSALQYIQYLIAQVFPLLPSSSICHSINHRSHSCDVCLAFYHQHRHPSCKSLSCCV